MGNSLRTAITTKTQKNMRTVIATTLAGLSTINAAFVAVNNTDSLFKNAADDIYSNFLAKLQDAEARVAAISAVDGRSATQDADLADAENNLAELRRFRQLKEMVLHTQPGVTFGKYCYYGCWCMAIGHEGFKGRGPVQDPVDGACKIHTKCYECAQQDENSRHTCNPETVKYDYTLLVDPVTNEREITCNDPYFDEVNGNKKSHCRRAICECDRGLSFRLAEESSNWIVDHHHKWDNFDTSMCVAQGNGGSSPDSCCGQYDYPNTKFPYSTEGGSRACCGQKTYDTNFSECCPGDIVAASGGC